MKKIYSETFRVPKSAIDHNGHVNNVTYLQWCIDIAEKHWIAKTDPSTREDHVWVVLEHTIAYKNPSFQGETLSISTWVRSAEGVKSERSYRIERPSDGKTIVEASSVWCFVNAKTHRPSKISEEICTLFV
ncbi:acyl-CoA thioesterase [Candidatus Ulvibacter alkanivorans]|uniref:acyl-CoA thioesterase n=1 Tax=Candidatus Ulvibacter alkanivorans TaxID=2267620 RepID=UPI001FE3FA13|nr:acyl-CoA thioesterase [Candidatus Ulvibacter alkanivorans]